MITPEELQKIKETIEEFFQKMTVVIFNVDIKTDVVEYKNPEDSSSVNNPVHDTTNNQATDSVHVNIQAKDPQFLIGQNGKTLIELQWILRILLHKKLSQLRYGQRSSENPEQQAFYITIDVNDYKKQKIEYLKHLAQDSANEVVMTQQQKVLPLMPAYERRIVHTELAGRKDVSTRSEGEGIEKTLVISPTLH